MNLINSLKTSIGRFPLLSPRGRPAGALATCVLIAGLTACSSGGDDKTTNGGTGGTTTPTGGTTTPTGGTTTPTGGTTTSKGGPVGSFAVMLNPAVEAASAYTSIVGKVHSGAYPTEVIETVIASDSNCKVYTYSVQGCFEPECTSDEVCVAKNVCEAKPTLVSVGDVTVDGVGPSTVKLVATNLNYQYPLDLPYPGVTEGQPVTLNGTGGTFPAFTVSAKGVAPMVLAESSYLIAKNQPLTVKWTPGDAGVGAEVTVTLNISKHGGSAGYMMCKTTDSGSLTISANVLQKLVSLGVAGFPELLVRRKTHGEATVSTGTISLDVLAEAKPALNVEGTCSCFNNSDCASCSDKTKTACDSVKKVCNTP